jgi:hypothetical protein
MTDIARKIIEDIKNGSIDSRNALDIVKKVAKAVRGDKEAAVEVIEILARGPDAVAGTADDYIPQETVAILNVLLESALVSQLAHEFFTKKCWCL